MHRDQSIEEQVSRLDNLSSAHPVAAHRDSLPSLPIIAATRLQLDLLRNESVIDLKRVTEVVLADAGATLQVLRLIGEEFPDDADRPKRIEDCIVSLSFARCYQTICASEIAHSGPHVAEWHRCRRIAECVREVAISLGSVAPEEAYLVGLLSRLGILPQLLGWKGDSSLSSESQALGVMLAFHWRLPHYVLLAIEEQHKSESSSKWRKILTLAQDMAGTGASDWAPQLS